MLLISSLSALRKILRVSQAEMAFFLGLSRPHYSMSELNRRPLSRAATHRAASLFQILNQEPDLPPMPEPSAEQKGQVLKKLLSQYQRSLERLEAREAEDLALCESHAQIAKVLAYFDRLELPDFNPETGRIFRELLEMKLPKPHDAKSHWLRSVEYRLEKEALLQKIKSLEEELGAMGE